jgi:hypothetical protein
MLVHYFLVLEVEYLELLELRLHLQSIYIHHYLLDKPMSLLDELLF